MNCSNCGSPIPAGSAYCPRCGALSPNPYASSGGSPNDPTIAPTPDIPPPPPSTAYGDPPYGGTPSYSQDASNPYNTPSSPYGPYGYVPPTPSTTPSSPQLYSSPPPPTPPRRGNRTVLLVVLPLLIVILVLGGVLALVLHSKTPGTATGEGTTPTPTLSASQLTATAQANLTATANANLTATAQANLTATASVIAANQNPYASGGTLAMLDPLTDNTRGFAWPQGPASDNSGACTFTSGGYQVNSNKAQFFYLCASTSNSYSNFTFEVHVQINKGDCGGLIFRSDSNAGKFYLFEVCTDGSYNLYIYRNFNGDSTLLANASSPAIKSGPNQLNVLAITAQGNVLTLYANSQKITSVTNSVYSSGQVGMVADSNNNPTGVLFSNARLWTS